MAVKGTLTEQTTSGGMQYLLYVPENVNSDTSMFVYVHGDGGKCDWGTRYRSGSTIYSVYEYAENTGGDQIIIAPLLDTCSSPTGQTMNLVEDIRKKYGITNYNLSAGGFSSGGLNALDIQSANIAAHKGALAPQIAFMIDDFSLIYSDGSLGYAAADMDNFKDNNTTLFILEQGSKYSPSSHRCAQALASDTALAERGLNIVRVQFPDDYAIAGTDEHCAICSIFFKNRLNEFIDGKVSLPNYAVCRVYNRETRRWEVISNDLVLNLEKVYDYYNITSLGPRIQAIIDRPYYVLQSDRKIVENYLNEILGKMKNSSFLGADFSGFSGSSTTQVPTAIPSVIESYFGKVTQVLHGVTKLSDSIAAIDPAYQEADQNLQKQMKS